MIRPPTLPAKSCTVSSSASRMPCRLEGVVDVVALERSARPVRDGAAVKVVAAGFDHGVDQQAAPRHLRVAAHRLHARPVDRVEVDVAALRRRGPWEDASTPSTICHGEPIWP